MVTTSDSENSEKPPRTDTNGTSWEITRAPKGMPNTHLHPRGFLPGNPETQTQGEGHAELVRATQSW